MSLRLLKMIAEGEHQRQDFKYCINDSRKIARSMVAFSNSEGGRLLLGVRDNGSVAGVKSEEEYYMAEAAARMYSQPPIQFKSQQWQVEGKTVLELVIPKGDELPYRAQNDEGKWLVYIRKGDQNCVAPGILLKIWAQEKNPNGVLIQFSSDEKRGLSLLEDHPAITLNQFTRQIRLPRWKAERMLIKFVSIGVVSLDITETGGRFSLIEELVNGEDMAQYKKSKV